MLRIHTVRSKTIPWGMMLLLAGLARADYNPITLTPRSFNADVVVEKTAPRALQACTTATMDSGTNNTGWTFYEQGYANFPRAGAAAATGLPAAGSTFAAVSDANHSFKMASSYVGNNAVLLGSYAGYTTGTLTLSTPAPYGTLSVLASAADGSLVSSVTVHYEGGTTMTTSISIDDWYSGSSIACYASGRVSINDGGIGNFSAMTPGSPRLLYYDIALDNTTAKVTSIDFTYTSGGRAAVFGLSGSTDGSTFTPITVTGYDVDMIVEAGAPTPGCTPTVSVTLDDGPGLGGTIFYETGLFGYTDGLPHAGGSVVYGNHTWAMASSYAANNCVFVGDYDGLRTCTVTLNAATAFSGFSFLTAAGNGPTSIQVDVTHTGGGTESFTISSLDWGSSASSVYTVGNRISPIGLGRGSTFYLHNADIALSDSSTPVTGLTFTYVSNGRAAIYAVAGKAPAGSSFSPVAVTGFNADAVVDAVVAPAPLFTATTASMDGGTNNNGSTWYEKGYYPAYPETGLPAAGSTFTSSALSDHHYQMPADYTTNNAVYVDSNHPSANLTLATPQAYSSLSFLSSCANGWVSNACVMQYQDGTTETNYFVSRDWFFNSPVAYTANGRVDLNTRTLNALNSGNPRLYEAQFALGNTVSPLTNVVLRYVAAQNPSSGRMVVLAVSATAGAFAPIIAQGTPASVTQYEGSNVVLTAQITGGTAPISKQWYYSSDSGTSWTQVSNGGTVSGATEASLTNSSIQFSNGGLYVLIAQNVAGVVTSSVATVTVVSSLPDVTVPGDPIVSFSNPNEPGEGVAKAIDHTTSKYLDWANGGSSFTGPAGFVVTPSMGKSTVSAIRFYTANDAPERDPASYTLEGSNDSGTTWTTIASGALSMPDGRNDGGLALNPLTQYLQEVRFGNTEGYTSYKVSINSVKGSVNFLQVGEIELLGVATTVAPYITVQPPATSKVYVGASPVFSVTAQGYPTNLAYQWYANSTPISGATSSSYTLANAQLTDSGTSFSCTITNTVGSTNSTGAVLTVVARPTQSYPVAILADNPAGFWRLDETDNGSGNTGSIVNDYVGGHTGTYNDTLLGVDGYNPALDADTAATFGLNSTSNSYAGGMADLNFATPTNTSAAFSVEAWVNGAAQTTDAGIITKGAGGGGEQYNLDCGAGSHGFRFFVRNATGGTSGANGTKGPDGKWHHVVGVCDQAHSNIVLYVDGISNAVGSATPGQGILSSTHPVSIGARQSGSAGGYDLQFVGTVDEAAIYAQALSASQVLAHYYAAAPAPVFTVQPTNTTAPEGTTATLYSLAYGPGTLHYQWYQSTDGGATFAELAGKTSANLALANVPASYSGYQYEVVVTNNNGAITSSVAVLTVVGGPPQFEVTLPTEVAVYAGRSITLAVTVNGTAPFSYQWQSNGVDLVEGGRFSGTHSNALTLANAQLGDATTYQVIVTNTQGSASAATTLYVNTEPNFNGNGAGWSLNGGATLGSSVLTLTDGGGSEARSSFYGYPQNIDAFSASFTYQDVNPPGNQADGFAFVLHNDPRGVSALGGAGGGLGLSGITPSAAVTFNIYSGSSGGVGMSFGINGANGAPYTATTPVSISGGNPIDVNMLYVGGKVHVTLTDATYGVSYSGEVTVALPTVLGADTAYVGFSGGTGGYSATQTISNFVFVSYPSLSAEVNGSGSVVLSWPASIGGYKLQGRANANSGTWTDVAATVTVVGTRSQVVVAPSAGTQFYRLVLQTP